MLHSDPNPFERQTDFLEQPQIRSQILFIHQISELISRLKWNKAFEKINTFLGTNKNTGNKTLLQMEIQMIQSLCLYKLGQMSQAEDVLIELLQILDPSPDQEQSKFQQKLQFDDSLSFSKDCPIVHQSLAIRAHTFAATMVITNPQTQFDFKEIRQSLMLLLQPIKMRIFIPEVLGTLTGCKNFGPLMTLKQLPGQPSKRLAQKLQIVADWKYIASLQKDAITFKGRAVQMWQQVNSHNQFTSCKKELKDLQNNNETDYMMKLKRIKAFTKNIIKMQSPPSINNKQILLKLNLPLLIQELLPPPKEQKQTIKTSTISQSRLKKQIDNNNTLQDIIAMCSRFYDVYKLEVNSETTNLILNSKFLQGNIIVIRRALAILVKLRYLRLREGITLTKLRIKRREEYENTQALSENRPQYPKNPEPQ